MEKKFIQSVFQKSLPNNQGADSITLVPEISKISVVCLASRIKGQNGANLLELKAIRPFNAHITFRQGSATIFSDLYPLKHNLPKTVTSHFRPMPVRLIQRPKGF